MVNAAEQLEFDIDQLQSEISPVLKWAGGKRWLTPRLNKLFTKAERPRLIEPFVGGMSVALALRPSQALLSDANPHLINFYKCLQQGMQSALKMRNEAEVYYLYRQRFNRLVEQNQADGQEAAELFYYLNRSCFNGLCRFNSSGRFNVPFGRYAKINYKSDFSSYSSVLKQWSFKCCDFSSLKLKPNDFIYADPPYDVEFTRYSKDDFVWDDQVRLAKWLAKHKGPVVATNQATERITRLYSKLGFKIEQISAPRRIACNGDRKNAAEVLLLRNI